MWTPFVVVLALGLFAAGSEGACKSMTSITDTHLRCVFPQLDESRAKLYAPHLSVQLRATGTSNSCQWAAILGNMGTESDGLTEWTQIPCNGATGAPYCGRGPLQITGPSNYRFCATSSKLCNCPGIYSHPEEVSENTSIGFGTAACVWRELSGHNLNSYADGSLAGFKATAEIINCGHLGCTPNGWASRQKYWETANRCLGN